MRRMRRFFATYQDLLLGLFVAAIVSWPGWWPHGSLFEGIASNVFATVFITPFLLFGVDSAVRDIQRKQAGARVDAVREEVRFVVARIIGACTTGTDKEFLPEIWNIVLSAWHAKTPIDADGTTDEVARYVVRNHQAVERQFLAIDWTTFDAVVSRAHREVPALRQALTVAGEAVEHEEFARYWRVARTLDVLYERAALVGYAVRSITGFEKSAAGQQMLQGAGHDLFSVLLSLSKARQPASGTAPNPPPTL